MNKAKKSKAKAKPKKKSKPKRRPAPDFAQQSLAMVERVIGGKLKSPSRERATKTTQ
jgi:hypothetical protein